MKKVVVLIALLAVMAFADVIKYPVSAVGEIPVGSVVKITDGALIAICNSTDLPAGVVVSREDDSYFIVSSEIAMVIASGGVVAGDVLVTADGGKVQPQAGFPSGKVIGVAVESGEDEEISAIVSIALSGGENLWIEHDDYIEAPLAGIRFNKLIHATRPAKIDANFVDPVMQIDGEQYSTWMAEAIGIRVDVVGEGRLENGSFSIDLAEQSKGSDLWLFYRTVAENSIIPFVSPRDMANLMCDINGSVFIVRVISGEENARFSYRLSGKRIDVAATPSEEMNVRPIKDRATTFIDTDQFDQNGNQK